MTIERLRSLEKEWRKESDDFERDGDEGTASAYYNCAEQLSAILADLGQEAGAVACRGYAKLGIGAYLIEHSAESEPAALMLCIASEEEKAGRTVGDLKTFEGERQPIPAEKMVVRIDFANVAGLDALEQQLRILREVHFPASTAHTSEARDAELIRALRNQYVSERTFRFQCENGMDYENARAHADSAVNQFEESFIAARERHTAMRQEAGDAD